MYKFIILIYLLSLTKTFTCAKRKHHDSQEVWTGKWFPFDPNQKTTINPSKSTIINTCDDGKHSIDVDFDPAKKQHSFKFLCLGNRTLYAPNLQLEALLTESFIPPAYVPPVKCLNESIRYETPLPTFGAYRLVAPKYGVYKYLPPQRWLRSLADGAVVLLYHPCAFPGQIKALETTLKGCLYRHIVTPSQQLSPERPLALLTWGKILQMSVVDDRIVVNFIKENAKRSQISTKLNEVVAPQLYEAGILSEARLVTDEEDSEICGYKNM